MHVAILAEFAVASGGAEKVALESARGLAEAGVAVTFVQAVAGPADPLLDHPRLRRICLDLDDVRCLPAWKGAARGIRNAEGARRLARALDGLAEPPDCFHLHQWTRAYSPSVLPVLLARGPVALSLHDYFLACPNGVYYRFDRGEPCACAPLSAACLAAPCDLQSRLHKLVRTGRALALRRALGGHRLHVIHVCDATQARTDLFGPGLRHHRLDNPVRRTRGAPADPAGGDAVAYVGRLTAEKGADLVARAARAAGLPALFVGAGPLADELRAMPGTEVVGWQSPEAVEGLLRTRARVLCAPSRWNETGPLTVYEALASGIPAVVSVRAGAAERVAHGLTGFTVEPALAPLAAALRTLRDDALVRRMGLAAHARYWSAPPTLAAHAAGLRAVYGTMLREARGGAVAQEEAEAGASSAVRGSVHLHGLDARV